MKTTKLIAAFALFAVLPSLPAQSFHVVPSWRAVSEGNGAGIMPFGYSRVRFTHVASRSLLKGLGAAAVLKEIDYRGDGGIAKTMTRKASASWTVRMANLALYPANPTPTFPAAASLSTVFKPKMVNWPSLPPPASPPGAWSIQFPFDVPFSYTGKSLVVDHYAFDSSTGKIYTYACDWEIAPNPGAGMVTPFGAGCPAGANRVTGYAPNPGGGDLALFLHGAPPGKTALAALGTPASTWGGIPLPFPLSSVGLPGCFLYTEIVTLTPLKVSASGMAELFLPVPGAPELLGRRLLGQFLVFPDSRVNPAVPLTTSEGLDIRLGTNLGVPAPAMYVIQAAQSQAKSKYGYLFKGEGPVFRLRT